MAALAVTAADPSGRLGFIRENYAGAKALISAKQTNTNELIRALIADLETSDGLIALLKQPAFRLLAGVNRP